MNYLAFDTSNSTLSVSVNNDSKQLSTFFSNEKKTHSITLLPAINQALKDADLTINDIDEIIVSQGPGSFTGLRIAVTTAKTLAWTLNIDLKGISSLELVAANTSQENKIIVPFFDARRSNVFAGAYKLIDGEMSEIFSDNHYTIDELIERLKEFQEEILFIGPKIDELVEKSNNQLPNAIFSDKYLPDASNLVKLSKNVEPVEDIDGFIPKYLRYTKAEYDWIKDTKDKPDDDYVQRV